MWNTTTWASSEWVELFTARARLRWVVDEQAKELPPMREDGIVVRDVDPIYLMGLFSSIGTLAFAGLQLHPQRFDEPILILAFTGGVVSFVLWRKSTRIDPEVAARRRNEFFHGPPRGRSRP